MGLLKKLTLAFVTFLALCVGFVIISDYKPPKKIVIETQNNNTSLMDSTQNLKLSIMNIGFGGLDNGQDFFMDGGSGSKSKSLDKTRGNIDKAIEFMSSNDSDVYLIQEVDIDSARTYYFDEKTYINKALPLYNSVGTTYYKVPFVPLPISAPMGKVEMELLTLSKTKVASTIRHALPNETKVPDKYFLLDRCMMESVIPLNNGKNLIVLNVHLSAYDSNGSVKNEQLNWIEDYIAKADLEENYYIFGGDWNLVLKEVSQEAKEELRDYWIEKPKTLKKEGFEWIYDDSINTVRELDAPYEKGVTYEQVIDGYLISPNLDLVSVKTHDLDFEFSDHNPVTLEVIFN